MEMKKEGKRGREGKNTIKNSEMTHFLYCEKPTQQTHPPTLTHTHTHTEKPVMNDSYMCARNKNTCISNLKTTVHKLHRNT